jgi:membrane protease YdiL (CAAX protease family)
LQLAGALHVVLLGIALPALVIVAHRRLKGGKRPLPDRMRHFQSTAFQLVVLTLFSVLVAKIEWIDLFSLDTARLPAGLGAGLGLYVAAVLYMRKRWRRAVEERAPIVHLFMPSNGKERAWWFAVSLLAGVGEEITWRGVQTQLLFGMTNTYVAAAILCAISFGLAHFIQGWQSAIVITVFALGLQVVAFVSGSLYVAMLVHVAYDITAGLAYGRLGRQLGYAAAAEVSRAAPSAGTRR